MAQTHLAFALLVALILDAFVEVNVFLFYPLILLGALLPDVDHKNSTINKWFPVTKWVPWFFEHRGFFHSVWPAVALFVLFHLAGFTTAGVYITTGYFAHLVSDGFTKMGVNLFWPVTKWRLRGLIQVNTLQEWVFFVVVLVGIVALLLL